MRTFSALFILCYAGLSAQESASVPERMAHGFLTLVTNQHIEFRDLRKSGDEIIFVNVETKSQFHYFPSAIRKIEDDNHSVVYAAPIPSPAKTEIPGEKAEMDSAAAPKTTETATLNVLSASNIQLDGKRLTPDEIKARLAQNPDALALYKRGQSNRTLGNVLLGGGIGLVIGGGIANLSSSTRTDEYGNTSTRGAAGPAPILIGLAAAGISIPIKISGNEKVRDAVSDYNHAVERKRKIAFAVVPGTNAIGLQMRF